MTPSNLYVFRINPNSYYIIYFIDGITQIIQWLTLLIECFLFFFRSRFLILNIF